MLAFIWVSRRLKDRAQCILHIEQLLDKGRGFGLELGMFGVLGAVPMQLAQPRSLISLYGWQLTWGPYQTLPPRFGGYSTQVPAAGISLECSLPLIVLAIEQYRCSRIWP